MGMGAEGICLLCSSRNGFSVDVLGPFPNSLKSQMGQCYVRSSDSKCWLLFIFNKILSIPEIICGELLSGLLAPQTNFRICGSCAQVVNKNAFYRQQILLFESKVDVLKKRAKKTLVQAQIEVERSSKVNDDHHGESYNVEDVITQILKAFDSSLLSRSEVDDGRLAENDSIGDRASGTTQENSGDVNKGNFRLEGASSSSSSSQDHVVQNDNPGHPPDDNLIHPPCNQFIPEPSKMLATTPKHTHFSLPLPDSERARGNYSTQPLQIHPSSSSSRSEHDTDVIQVPTQRRERTNASVETRSAHFHKPTTNSKSDTSLARPETNESSESNGNLKEGDFRIEQAFSPHNNVAERASPAHQQSNNTLNGFSPGKSIKCPRLLSCSSEETKFSLEVLEEESTQHDLQPNPSSSENQPEVDATILLLRNEGTNNDLSNSLAHTSRSTKNSNPCGKLTKQNINIGEKLSLRNGTCGKRGRRRNPNKLGHVGRARPRTYIMRTNTGRNPFGCQLCNKAFSNATNLSTHMRTHTKERPFKCEICLKTFAHPGHTKRHVDAIHRQLKPFKCQICIMEFPRLEHLKDHMRVHTKETPYNCIMCERNFSIYSSLVRHLRVHTNEKPFYCVYCGMEFRQFIDLKSHKSKCHGQLAK